MSGIAKSIAKWTYGKFSQESFIIYKKNTHSSDIQRVRGLKSGVERRANSIEEKAPWLELGISRGAYFYKKKSGSFLTQK